MKYEKPEMVLFSSALDSIQSSQKIDPWNPDQTLVYSANSAYEADE